MSKLDWDAIRLAKNAHRARMASLSLSEKLSKLERLRERQLLIRKNRVAPRQTPNSPAGTVLLSTESRQRTESSSKPLYLIGGSQVFMSAIATDLRVLESSSTFHSMDLNETNAST
jgi:hypothetical protein